MGNVAEGRRTVTATDTLDLGKGVDNLLLAVHVGVQQTQNVVEVALWEMLACILNPAYSQHIALLEALGVSSLCCPISA